MNFKIVGPVKIALVVAFLAVAINPAFASPKMPDSGEANCLEMADSAGCQIAWNFSANPAGRYFVQRFDQGKARWVQASPNYRDPYSYTRDKISTGGLYRVAACNGRDKSNRCHYSSVLWIPFLLELKDMPNEVLIPDSDGATMIPAAITLNGPDHLPHVQFNIYTMINVAHELELPLPDMSHGLHPDDPDASSLAHIIRDNVYDQYQLVRPEMSNLRGGID